MATARRTYFYPEIDYRQHPAFNVLDVASKCSDAEVEGRIDAIDFSLAELHAHAYPDQKALDQAFAQKPATHIRALAEYLQKQDLPSQIKFWLERSFEDVSSELLTEARLRNDRHRFIASSNLTPHAQIVAEAMRNDGVFVCRMDQKDLQALLKLTVEQRRRLREKAQTTPERIVENFHRYSDVGMIIAAFLKDKGVLDGLSSYMKANTNFAGFALEYSHDRQTWWHGCYSDVGLPESQTTYMHYDQGCKYPKAILMLSEITEENGPTGYIRGSNRESRSNFVHFMIKSLDKAFDNMLGASEVGIYYRRRFGKAEYPRELLMLPRAFHGCSHFGEDIIDGSPLSNELLKRELRLTSDVGNFIVFDGDYGIHRGATVRNGERFAFQIIFYVEPPTPIMRVIDQRGRVLVKKLLGLNR